MATADISEKRIYTDQPVAPLAERLEVRARLTSLELLALAAVIGVCVSVIGFEYGYRRPARAAADAAAQARQLARVSAVPAPRSARADDVAPAPAPAPAVAQPVDASQPITAITDPTAIASSSIAAVPAAAPARADGPVRAADPFQTPGTIYRCRRYDGSVFWSSLHCAKHRGALIERIARVPADQPFDAQVRIASDEARRVEASLRAEQAEIQRTNTCATLIGEQAQILRRAGDATVLAQVQATDRTRGREIDAAMQRLRCNG